MDTYVVIIFRDSGVMVTIAKKMLNELLYIDIGEFLGEKCFGIDLLDADFNYDQHNFVCRMYSSKYQPYLLFPLGYKNNQFLFDCSFG